MAVIPAHGRSVALEPHEQEVNWAENLAEPPIEFRREIARVRSEDDVSLF